FFDLLPEALKIANRQNRDAKYVFAVVITGFVVFYLIERIVIWHACPEGDCENDAHKRVGRMGAIGLIAHSTLDGMAIGAASLVDWQTGFLVALAVVAHDSSDGLNTILLITRGEKAQKGDIVFLLLDAVAPIVGGVIALFILPTPTALMMFLALASGFFLYTATSDLLPEAHRRSPSLAVSLAAISGIILIGAAVTFIGA
ncbi:MAG: ZIP family metal transporter, partial [Gemmatimonadota bacterium]|nr:ZIP family metal transporter [Gemmatimonadota bacterium]